MKPSEPNMSEQANTNPTSTVAEERVHHPYSPSTLQSLEACPCYQSRPSQHVRTIIGTLAHKATETRVDDAQLDDDDASAVAQCLDFYDRRRREMEQRRFHAVEARTIELWGTVDSQEPCIGKPGIGTDARARAEQQVPPVKELLETYLSVDNCIFDDAKATTAGYVDRVIISHDRKSAELFDWKFGLWPIEKAENNLQGIAYVLGLFREYPSIESAKFFFKQPLLDDIQEATFTRADVAALYLRVQVVVAQAREARRLMALNDWSKARPMVPACNFCAHLGRCPKVIEIACKVGSKFFPLEIPENITPTMVLSKESTTLAIRLSQVLATWAKAFRAVLTDRVIRRDALPPDGFTLTSRSEREIVDSAKYKAIALDYLTESEYSALLDISLTAVEKEISKKAERGQKTATVDEFKKKLEDSGAIKHGDAYAFLKATANKN